MRRKKTAKNADCGRRHPVLSMVVLLSYAAATLFCPIAHCLIHEEFETAAAQAMPFCAECAEMHAEAAAGKTNNLRAHLHPQFDHIRTLADHCPLCSTFLQKDATSPRAFSGVPQQPRARPPAPADAKPCGLVLILHYVPRSPPPISV